MVCHHCIAQHEVRTDESSGRKARSEEGAEGDAEEQASKKVKTEESDEEGDAGETPVESEFN